MLPSFAAENITHSETSKDKIFQVSFYPQSRNVLQSNLFVLEIASLHDNLFHSSFSALSDWARQNTKHVSI